MIEFNVGEKLYTFMGENLIEFKFMNYIDELRLTGEDDNCTYTFFKKDCYRLKQNAIIGMGRYLKEVEID